MEEKNGSKVGMAIAIIFAIIIVGILVFSVAMNSKQDDSTPDSLMESTAEQKYDNHGLSFTFPHNYVITNDEMEDGIIDVLCEAKGSVLSQIEVSAASMEEFKLLTNVDKDDICRSTLETMKDQLRGNILYKNITFSPVNMGKLGEQTCYQSDFTVSVLSVTAKGAIKMVLSDVGQMIITVTLCENEKDKVILEKIENSIKLQ